MNKKERNKLRELARKAVNSKLAFDDVEQVNIHCTPGVLLHLLDKLDAADQLADYVDDIYHDPRCSRFKYADCTCDCSYIELIEARDTYRKSCESDGDDD